LLFHIPISLVGRASIIPKHKNYTRTDFPKSEKTSNYKKKKTNNKKKKTKDGEKIQTTTVHSTIKQTTKKMTSSRPAASDRRDTTAASTTLHEILETCRDKTVVLCGCGGGYDVFGALYLYGKVKPLARRVVLANLSFTSARMLSILGESIMQNDPPLCFCVPPGLTPLPAGYEYFAEAYLADRVQQPVYAFLGSYMSVEELTRCHEAILNHATGNSEEEAVLFLMDGGCDVFLKGNEEGLGTPEEDILHLKATMRVSRYINNPSFVCAIGVNIDEGHGVKTDDWLGRLEEMKETGTLRFEKVLDVADPDARFYCEAVRHSRPVQSIVQSLTVAAVEGHRGQYTPAHLYYRITRNMVELRDETATFYIMDRSAVVRENLYVHLLCPTDRREDLTEKVRKLRNGTTY
jgi:hypothetical protein